MTDDAPPGVRAGGPADSFRAVFINASLRRAVIAYFWFNFGEWATWIAILVHAFQRGGATESGIVALLQLVPAAIVAPMAANLADRWPRERALLGAYGLQAAAMTAAAAALLLDGPSPVVYLFAAATTTAVSLARPAHGSLLPSLAMTPAQLTAANVASGAVQNVSILLAPTVAGLLLAVSGAGAVFVLTAGGMLVASLLVAGVKTEPHVPTEHAAGERLAGGDGLAAGFTTLFRLAGPRTIVVLIGAGGMIEGALDVLVIVLAIDLLKVGEAGVGFLGSAVGAGGLIGAAAAATLVGRPRLARPFALGLVLWGLPLALVGLAPIAVLAFALLLAAGAGRSLMDVAGRTLLQRAAPGDVLARVLGVLEGLHMAMLGLGSIAVPALIGLIGAREALVAVGLFLPLAVAASWRALKAVDAAAVVHVRELELLRAIPLFAPLAPQAIERLSANLVPVRVLAGDWVIRQGDSGDRYYVVDQGRTEVFIDDRLVRSEGPGSGFGEIALLRDVPRTASVRAATDLGLFALDRDAFLATVSGHPKSRRSADDLVAERLASA